MADITNLFGTTGGAKMREAMRQLGSYYGVKDKNSFVQVLIKRAAAGKSEKNPSSSEMSKQARETNHNLSVLADAIISLQGDGVFSDQFKGVFDDYIEGQKTNDPSDPIAKVLKDPASKRTKDTCPISLTLPINDGKELKGYLRGVGVADMFDTVEVDFNTSVTEDRKAISIIEFHHPYLNFANRDSAASSIFLMALPSIEISKAVPYFDMKTIVKGDAIQTLNQSSTEEKNPLAFGNGISIYKFLNGEKIEKGNAVLQQLASMTPAEFQQVPKELSGGVQHKDAPPKVIKSSVTVAGMELFTSPQTMVDGTLIHEDLNASSTNYGSRPGPKDIPVENKVLDKFRPLMTVKSFNVQVTPATGMLATKAADVKVTLHDKTRMNQVMPFIVPGQLGDVEFLIEWGWSHPESDPEINPYGALINSMRCKEKYGIMNSSYSFTPTGEVEIGLKLYTKGASNATFELVSSTKDGKNPIDVLKEFVNAIRSQMRSLKQQGFTMNAEMGAPDVLGKASSVGGLLSLKKEERTQITNFLNKMKKSAGKSASSESWGKLVQGFDDAMNKEGGVKDFQKTIQDQFKNMIDNCCQEKSQVDPYLVPMNSNVIPGLGEMVMNIEQDKYVSLAKVITTFVANPILETGRFQEVQLCFYPMNEYAMWARTLNTGQYPLNKGELKSYLEEQLNVTPSMTIQKFLNLIKKHFVNFVGDDIYGLSSFYKTTDEGKRELAEKWTKDEKAKQQYTQMKVKILEDCYQGTDSEKRFKKPNIQMWVECVGHVDKPEYTILRLHFFDRACTSYGSYASMWGATNASNLGIIGKSNSANRQYNKAMEKPPKKKDAKWEQLVESRLGRVTDYAPLAKAQTEEFIKNGLLEEITYTAKDRQTGKEVTKSKYRINGGPDQLRGILAANMPTLKYGTEFSGILSANLATNSNPQMEVIHMQRQGAKSGAVGAVDDGLPMTIKPVTLSLETFGCPYINFGQQFFCDFQTNTTTDDIYAVSGVSHNISPGEFKTSIQMTPLNKLGQFRSMVDTLEEAAAVSAQVEKNIKKSD